MNQTRPPALSPEDIRHLERLAERGAKIVMANENIAKVQTWVILAIGSVGIGVAGWGIKSINDLNQTMTRVMTQNEYRDQKVQALETRFEKHLNDVVRPMPDVR